MTASFSREYFLDHFEPPQRELASHYLDHAERLGFLTSIAKSSATVRAESQEKDDIRFAWLKVPKSWCPKGEIQLYLKGFSDSDAADTARQTLLLEEGVREAEKHTLKVDLDKRNLSSAYKALDVIFGIARAHLK